MKADFPAIWAESPGTLRREPTNSELVGGFPCGALDLQLFNELMHRLSIVYREFSNIRLAAGIPANAGDAAQALKAIRGGLLSYYPDTGTANSIILTPTPPVTALQIGMLFVTRPNATNTGPAVANINGTTLNVVRQGGAPTSPNDLVQGRLVQLMYDGANLQILGITQVLTTGGAFFSTPGSEFWAVPAGVTRLRARVWGGGGGGGGTGGAGASGAGGNGGGYAEGSYSVIPAQVLTVTVGGGGIAGTTNPGNENGGAGGTSSLGSLISATGGGGGEGKASGSGNASLSTGFGIGGQFVVNGQSAANSSGSGGAGAFAAPGTSGSGSGGIFAGYPAGGGGGAGSTSIGFAGKPGAGGLITLEF